MLGLIDTSQSESKQAEAWPGGGRELRPTLAPAAGLFHRGESEQLTALPFKLGLVKLWKSSFCPKNKTKMNKGNTDDFSWTRQRTEVSGKLPPQKLGRGVNPEGQGKSESSMCWNRERGGHDCRRI